LWLTNSGLWLADPEVKNIHDQERFAVEQNHAASDYYVLAIGRRRRKAALKIVGTPRHFLSQAGR